MIDRIDDRAHELSTVTSPAQSAAVERVCNDIANCNSVQDINEIRIQSDSLGSYARKVKAGREVINNYAEIMIRAERRAGELIISMKLSGGDQKSENREDRISLKDIGVSPAQSCRWRKVASIPEDIFEEAIQSASEESLILSTNLVLRFADSWKKRTVNKRNSPEPKTGPRRRRKPSRPPREIIDDMAGHNATLSRVLMPVLESTDPVDLKEKTKKYLTKILRDNERLLADLKAWHPSETDDIGLG